MEEKYTRKQFLKIIRDGNVFVTNGTIITKENDTEVIDFDGLRVYLAKQDGVNDNMNKNSNQMLKDISATINELMLKINDISLRLDKVEQRLDNIEQRLDKVEQRLDNLEKDVGLIKRCPTIKRELENLN